MGSTLQELFSYSEQEVLSKPVEILLREEYREIHQGKLERYLQKGLGQCGHIGIRAEKTFRRKNGSLFTAEVSMSGARNDDFRIIVLVVHDITERKKAEQALKDSEEKLKESNATKDKFFSIIAHDLKSPLSSMLGLSEILMGRFEQYDTEKQKKYLGLINTNLKNTYKLLENLLLWSQSQEEIIDFKAERIYLHLLVDETSELFRQSAENKAIRLINQIPENISIDADKDMLSTIIRNLLSNAVKFTPKGGDIIINAKQVEANEFIEISVKDTGVGIPKDRQSKLFDIGEDTSTRGTEKETGTGLGLIICKEFVEKHGGRIWVESKVGKGSEFMFTLSCSAE